MIAKDFDKNIYEPHLCESGVNLDSDYERVINTYRDAIWQDTTLINAGKAFNALHNAQYNAVKHGKGIQNRKNFRNKTMTESVISAWAFVDRAFAK